jgi:hypothetical protein
VAGTVRDDTGVGLCAAAVRSILDALPEDSYTLEEEIVRPRNRRGKPADELLSITITPAREDAAAILILLPVGGDAYLVTGSGERRNRYEFLRTEVPLDAEIGAMVEAVVAGRIEEETVYGRGDRVVRHCTEITLADGSAVPVNSVRQILALRKRRERFTYRPYA